MELTEKDVEKLATLARIELTPEEKKRFASQLSSILDYVKQLDEVDTKDVGLGTHVPLTSSFRQDSAEPWPDVQPIVTQFPDRAGNLNKIKPVLE
ncbi:MAG: Asp-tRNA(Asn)/Glu-tRNA(Gln) amidotransferase subunit GatC [Patescibacteria group bacterium]